MNKFNSNPQRKSTY